MRTGLLQSALALVPGPGFSQGSFTRSVLVKNAERVLLAEVTRLFLGELDAVWRPHGWTRDEHCTVNGPRLKAWRSLESFVRNDGSGPQKRQAAKEEDAGHRVANFRGERRTNATHRATTHLESVLEPNASGKRACLCLGGPVLPENRPGLWAEFPIQDLIAEPEPVVALEQGAAVGLLDPGMRVRMVRTDKGDVRKGLLPGSRQRRIAPQVAPKDGARVVAGSDEPRSAKVHYRLSHKVRKRVEEIFGCIKTLAN